MGRDSRVAGTPPGTFAAEESELDALGRAALAAGIPTTYKPKA